MVNDQDLVQAMRQRRAEGRHKLRLLRAHEEMVAVSRVRLIFAGVALALLVAALALGGGL